MVSRFRCRETGYIEKRCIGVPLPELARTRLPKNTIEEQFGSGITTGGEIVAGTAQHTAGIGGTATRTGGIVVATVGNAPTARTDGEPTAAPATTTYAASISILVRGYNGH
ncbi:hypothetical protein RIF29_14954 [Crotalaria pallida]|uniref:Uncharacterized protein n=1 Tax=Crotalaria pallida TaxID=3830 RepID=A0AAN9FEC3_CROPI